jgi:hypothetical protein
MKIPKVRIVMVNPIAMKSSSFVRLLSGFEPFFFTLCGKRNQENKND